MRRLVLCLFLLLFVPVLAAGTERTGTIVYHPGGNSAAQTQWLGTHFNHIVGAGPYSPRDYSPEVYWHGYKDFSVVYPYSGDAILPYPNEAVSVKEFAIAQGWTYEDLFVHMTVDYVVSAANLNWTGMDQFGTWGDAGVYLYSGGSYTNKKDAAYNATAGDVALVDTLYLGYEEPFDRATFIHSTYAVGASFVWEYWNGTTWATLTLADNGTTSFTQNGTMIWTPPANWTTVSVNGTRAQWWVRVRVTSATTKPVWTSIKGDDWRASSTQARGWNATDPNRVNVGTLLEYNPNPPANATARFRYQSRITGAWASRVMLGNPKNEQGGVRTWGKWLHYILSHAISQRGYNATFLDDTGTVTPTSCVASPTPEMDYTDIAGSVWKTEGLATLDQLVADFAVSHPSLLVGMNGYDPSYAMRTGFNFDESGYWPRSTKPTYGYSATRTYMDNYLPATNPLGTLGMHQCNDPFDFWELNGERVFLDRNDRTPIQCLSMYLIGRNNNTVFEYHSYGNYVWYRDSDEFFEWVDGSTLTQPLTADGTTATKTITVASTAGWPTTSFPASFGTALAIKIGDEIWEGNVTKATATTLTTPAKIWRDHAAGELVQYAVVRHHATDTPNSAKVARWGGWFPAMAVDFGDPDPSGLNGGVRNLAWKSTAQLDTPHSTVGPLYRRDFTKAIVLYYPTQYNTPATDAVWAHFSPAIALGGTYYRLRASGVTEPAITSISLRPGEGAILMKAPVNEGEYDPPDPPGDVIPPSRSALAPSGVQTCDANPRSLTLSLTTNENATCKYGTVDAAYSSLPSTFGTTGGTSHNQAVSVPCGASYAYHVRCQDMAGNANTSGSAISFSVAAATPAADAIPPGRILDLAISNRGVATWTETGDDGEDGTASLRELRCKIGSSFVAADWAAGLNLTGLPSVAASMTARTATVQGLVTGSPVTCGMRATDEEGNLGLLGNVVTVTLTPPTGEAARLGSTPLRLLGRPVRFAR
jgi:hypothetical protein